MTERVGLIATSRKTLQHPAPAIDFFRGSLFTHTILYAQKHYDRYYLFDVKNGLLLPDDILIPKLLSIKTLTKAEKQAWAESVIREFREWELPECITVYIHGGLIYRQLLEPELKKYGFTYEVPFKGFGIGEQLNWYKEHLKTK
ncbi:DUF6884 domain-containing protein [Tuberibacillus calidus]|jgi:hypothetical protein|uniref:DUF6884 domain-containing protein n=1 Tax=Tuberibacillus calidus TaxID=340097 RepID=UPI000423A0ED|nr:DUF6884 domain-containing protein [Tuberibacillus calidus]